MSALQLKQAFDGGNQLSLNGRHIELKDFSECLGRYDGAVFIVASGPSTADFPLERYANFPMIAMNGSIARFSGTGVRPLFFLCDDTDVAEKKSAAVLVGMRSAEHAALSFGALKKIVQVDPEAVFKCDLHLLERVNRGEGGERLSDRRFAWSLRNNPDYEVSWSLLRQKANRIGFSRNLAGGYFSARTIAYAAVQLAYHLGFKKVFLVGVDMRPDFGQFYDPQGQVVRSCLGEDFSDHILPSFKLLAAKVVSARFRVFNMSLNSLIPGEVIPKVTIEQVDELLAEEL
jgi:Kdo-III transferase WaaZ